VRDKTFNVCYTETDCSTNGATEESPVITEINRDDSSETITINCAPFVEGGGHNLGSCRSDLTCNNKEDFCLDIAEHDLTDEGEHKLYKKDCVNPLIDYDCS